MHFEQALRVSAELRRQSIVRPQSSSETMDSSGSSSNTLSAAIWPFFTEETRRSMSLDLPQFDANALSDKSSSTTSSSSSKNKPTFSSDATRNSFVNRLGLDVLGVNDLSNAVIEKKEAERLARRRDKRRMKDEATNALLKAAQEKADKEERVKRAAQKAAEAAIPLTRVSVLF